MKETSRRTASYSPLSCRSTRGPAFGPAAGSASGAGRPGRVSAVPLRSVTEADLSPRMRGPALIDGRRGAGVVSGAELAETGPHQFDARGDAELFEDLPEMEVDGMG